LQEEAGSSILESDVQDATDRLNSICDELALSSGILYDIYLSAC